MVVLNETARLVRVGLSFVVPYRTSLRKGFILPIEMKPAYSAFVLTYFNTRKSGGAGGTKAQTKENISFVLAYSAVW